MVGILPLRGRGDKVAGLGLERTARRAAGLKTLRQRQALDESRSKGGADSTTASTGCKLTGGEG